MENGDRPVCSSGKDWNELNIEDKIERTRTVLKDMIKILKYQEKEIRELRDNFNYHRHDGSEILFSRRTSFHDGIEICSPSKSKDYF